MKYNPEKYHRRSIRLKGYNYAQAGAYFVTIVAQGRACLFGEVADGTMRANDAGGMVHREWLASPTRFTEVGLDAFVVMPNHCHGIITIGPSVGATLVVAPDAHRPIRRYGCPKKQGRDKPCPYRTADIRRHCRRVQIHYHPCLHPGRKTVRLAAIPRSFVAAQLF